MTEKRVLLAILAHPDDESFGPGGTLARYAAEGVDVHLCTLTDGAAGTVDPNCEDCLEGYRDMADRRLQELQCAVKILGATLHFFGYRDSGMAGDEANAHPEALINQPLEEVAGRLAGLMRQLQPDVILTHDETGGYFHPDHIAAHRATLAAYQATYAGRQPAPGLYCSVIPRTFVRTFTWLGRLMGQDPTQFGRNKDIDLTRIGKPPDQIHVRVDIRDFLKTKQEASACHSSQGGHGGLGRQTAFSWRQWLISQANATLARSEMFQQLYPPPRGRRQGFFE
jgi:LmbE family N-acetylglucosaminyl deacetylase